MCFKNSDKFKLKELCEYDVEAIVNGYIYVTSNTTNFTDWLNVLLLVHTVLYIYHCDVGFNVFRKDKV